LLKAGQRQFSAVDIFDPGDCGCVLIGWDDVNSATPGVAFAPNHIDDGAIRQNNGRPQQGRIDFGRVQQHLR